MPNNTVLFIGAHPDDIEIGAGGTVAKLIQQGCEVWWCILTVEADSKLAQQRRNEVSQAALLLGLQADHVLFMGAMDGKLTADRDTIGILRNLVAKAGINPLFVCTHSEADSHNDHRAAALIARGTFRETIILHYGVVNSLVESAFYPRLFIDTTPFAAAKRRALEAHNSQVTEGRILWKKIQDAEANYAARIGASAAAEAFEISIQLGTAEAISRLQSINDCPFHAFWYALIENRKLINIHAVPVDRRPKHYRWASDLDREGMNQLRRAFAGRWFGPLPVDELRCDKDSIDELLYNNDILLSGGAVSNIITRSHFNHLPGLRYLIDYDMPEYSNIRIWDREAKKEIVAEYEPDELVGRKPKIDRCIFTVMKNPWCRGRHLLGCMGIHGFGGLGGYMLMTEPSLLKEFLSHCPFFFPEGVEGYQVLAQIDVRLMRAEWDWVTLHEIRSLA